MCFIMYACAHLSCIILGFVVSNKIPLHPHYMVVCFKRESRPNPAIIEVEGTGTGETGRLLGGFPKARLALREGTENPCGRRSQPE